MPPVTPLKLAIVMSGRTQTDIAEEVGVHPGSMAGYAGGYRTPSKAMQKRIARALRKTPAELWPDPEQEAT